MNLLQLSENLQCAKTVIQVCQEKKNLLAKSKVAGHVSILSTKKKKKKKKLRKSYAWRCRNTKCKTWIIIKLLGESTE